MAGKKQRLLSGVKPTGRPHIGNYFGAMRQFVNLQYDYDSFVFIADYHALTSERLQQNPTTLHDNIVELAKDYLAIGLDLAHVTLYQQSSVPEVTELAWIYNCLLTVPYLQRAHAYKDAQVKGKNVNVGTFAYPVLMAADILIMDADIVPVGKDQQQHLEITRDIVEKFNAKYGNVFVSPKGVIMEEVAVVPGTNGQKMSKSYGNTIPLFGTDDEIRTAVMSIITNSTPAGGPLNPETDTTFALHRHFSAEQLPDLEKRYHEGTIGYKESKELLAENVISLIAPMRERREALLHEDVKKILTEGGEKARTITSAKMREVREKVGITL
jgi:tryptophanyl-tRNA synthetase